jgi:hypothetical protein
MGNPFAYIHCSLAQQNIFATLRYFAERGFGLLDFLINRRGRLLYFRFTAAIIDTWQVQEAST